MPLFDIFRRRPPIHEPAALADFIDENAAFLVQRGIYEYSRARAGHYAKVLLGEVEFIASADESRWRAYPLGLAMVGEMAEGVLRAHVGDDRGAMLDSFGALVLSVFDRHAVPTRLGRETWLDARADLARRLSHFGLHPPKRVMDIPEPLAEGYFALMPIHEKLRGRDFPTVRNYLRVALCNIHDELIKRMDVPAVADSLLRAGPTQ